MSIGWFADHLMEGMIMMELYSYQEEKPRIFLHIFRISLQFDDQPVPFEGVAFIPIPFDTDTKGIPDFTFDGESLVFFEDFIDYD